MEGGNCDEQFFLYLPVISIFHRGRRIERWELKVAIAREASLWSWRHSSMQEHKFKKNISS